MIDRARSGFNPVNLTARNDVEIGQTPDCAPTTSSANIDIELDVSQSHDSHDEDEPPSDQSDDGKHLLCQQLSGGSTNIQEIL